MECRETVPSGQKTNHTCMEAVILVALVVYIFLHNWSATLISLIAFPL
ncbi:MAG: efflux RND transporter permease subunit [Akkermansiaceae bacterium]|nr:efflux RND transporter permease subunit [Akkermansiaceae bacterium]